MSPRWRSFGGGPGASETKTDALHAMIRTPLLDGDYIYGVDSYGELRCLDAKTGDRVWEDLTAVPKARWATIHMVRNGERIWMFNERGELIIERAFAARVPRNQPGEADRSDDRSSWRSAAGVCWSHPAYAYKHVFARNDRELVCASLAAEENRRTDW